MSKKLWCRKCLQFEMHDSFSQTENAKLRAEIERLERSVRVRNARLVTAREEIERLQAAEALNDERS